MSLVGSVHRTLRLQKCANIFFHRSLCTSVNHRIASKLIQTHIRSPVHIRLLATDSSDKKKSPTLETQQEVDIGPGTWQEVYNGILTTQIRMVKLFSLSTSCMGVMMQPVLFQKVVGTSQAGLAIATGSFIGFFTFVTPLIIHWITKKYVTRLEYDQEHDIYSATTLSFFLREKKIHFTVDDVKVPDVPGLFTTFLVKDRPLFVEPKMFENIEHYGRLMGYDKPLDFSLDDDDDKNERK